MQIWMMVINLFSFIEKGFYRQIKQMQNKKTKNRK